MGIFSFIYWDPDPQMFFLPGLGWPIFWYGGFFALGFAVGFSVFYRLVLKLIDPTENPSGEAKKMAMRLADRLTMYVIVATIVGARLGHYLFYENPSDYLARPLEIFLIRKGGLASHGAAIGIVIGVMLFARRYKSYFEVHWIRLLDLICVPTALAGACIRVGNFCNQEILGTVTTMPWAVIFGHPMDRSFPAPRHPVQLYEAVCYLAIFILLWRFTYLSKYFRGKGFLFGLFLVLTFSSRFCIEFFKVEQSFLIGKSFFTMGQVLSIFPIGAGAYLLYFFFRQEECKRVSQ
ncbi:MAG: prolipoprotein diacylglyceryl transferase [Chlamydiales bacterium]|nr:prolipoprotein diacylglyceryl transferase [Chlamydiales bacterium]